MPAHKSPPWTSAERAILADIFPREGINGAADALPDRSWQAINVMASKLGIRSGIVGDAPQPKLSGDRLEEAIRLREVDGWAFGRIGATFGVSEAAASNAVLIALCPRRGFTPAERDEHGRLTEAGLDRLREMLRKGMKGVDIQIRLGVSAGCVAEQRRRYRADLKARGKAPLPAPGKGARYSGVKLSRADKLAVEALFLEGLGAKKINERTGISHTSIVRIRARLVKRLKRKGECLPGCGADGRRGAAKVSLNYIPADAVAALRDRLLAREPVRRAALAVGIGGSSAYRIRDALAAELAAGGGQLPKPILPGKTKLPPADWLPREKAGHFRALAHQLGVEAAREMVLAEMRAERQAAIEEARRPKSFEEQLAAVKAGARLVARPVIRRPDPAMTLGGIASAAI
jgi:hypothetical protein